MNRHVATLLLAIASISTLGAGCASDDDASAADLPPLALEGRDVARSNGCAACHGSNGEGGVGPPYAGLFGSDVELQSGESVVADRDYLYRAITDPAAQVRVGYNLPMPSVDLDDDEIDAVIAYIEALAEVTP